MSETRLMLWSVRREAWEHRSIWFAPLVAAGVLLFGFFIGSFHLPHTMRTLSALDPVRQQATIEKPYAFAPVPLLFIAFLVGIFYCLDALHGERRDRSVLFWKSLPV